TALAVLRDLRIADPAIYRALSPADIEHAPIHVTATESGKLSEPQTRQRQEHEHIRIVLYRARRKAEHLPKRERVALHIGSICLRQRPKMRLNRVAIHVPPIGVVNQAIKLFDPSGLTALGREVPALNPITHRGRGHGRERSTPPPRRNRCPVNVLVTLKRVPGGTFVAATTRLTEIVHVLAMKLTDGDLLGLRPINSVMILQRFMRFAVEVLSLAPSPELLPLILPLAPIHDGVQALVRQLPRAAVPRFFDLLHSHNARIQSAVPWSSTHPPTKFWAVDTR